MIFVIFVFLHFHHFLSERKTTSFKKNKPYENIFPLTHGCSNPKPWGRKCIHFDFVTLFLTLPYDPYEHYEQNSKVPMSIVDDFKYFSGYFSIEQAIVIEKSRPLEINLS